MGKKMIITIVGLLLLASFALADVIVEDNMVSFYYDNSSAKSVYLAGTFNDWDPKATPMKNENGEWFVQLKLKPGVYEYRFVVDDTKWVEDPDAWGRIESGLGGYNSVFVLKSRDEKLFVDIEASKNYGISKAKKANTRVVKPKEITLPKGYESNVVKDEKLSPHIVNGKVIFSFRAPDAQKVNLAGSFNNWGPDALGMEKKDGIWQAAVALEDGVYQYKYVINSSTWKEDPNSYGYVSDPYGGKNSVLIIKDGKVFVPKVEVKRAVVKKVKIPTAVATPTKAQELKAGPQVVDGYILFRFKYPAAGKVNLAGMFNNWDPNVLSMKLSGDGYWEAKLKLTPGSYEYKYVVDGKTWIEDPNAPEYVPDPYGGRNSVVTIKRENGVLKIVKPVQKSSNMLSGSLKMCFAGKLNELWFSPYSYNSITLSLAPKISNIKLNANFEADTAGWSLNFKGVNMRIEKDPFVLDIYNNWQTSNIGFMNMESIEATTTGIYGNAYGIFLQGGNINGKLYYGIGLDTWLSNFNVKAGYFDPNFALRSFGYTGNTISLQAGANMDIVTPKIEVDLANNVFKDVSIGFYSESLKAFLSYSASQTIRAQASYLYSLWKFNGKVSAGYDDGKFLGYIDSAYSIDKNSNIYGVLKYFDNAIDKYISYNIDTGNIDLSLFYGNDVFPINGLDEDFSISHSSDNYIGLYTNMSF